MKKGIDKKIDIKMCRMAEIPVIIFNSTFDVLVKEMHSKNCSLISTIKQKLTYRGKVFDPVSTVIITFNFTMGKLQR